MSPCKSDIVLQFIFTMVNIICGCTRTTLQLDPDNSSSDNSKSPLIRSNIHFPWSALLLTFTWLIRTLVNSNYFPFPLGIRINGVQLYTIGDVELTNISRETNYSRTSLIRTPKGQSKVSVLERCPY